MTRKLLLGMVGALAMGAALIGTPRPAQAQVAFGFGFGGPFFGPTFGFGFWPYAPVGYPGWYGPPYPPYPPYDGPVVVRRVVPAYGPIGYGPYLGPRIVRSRTVYRGPYDAPHRAYY